MSEQIRITVDLDEAIYALKGLSKAEEEIAIKFQNCGLQDEAMEHFRNERDIGHSCINGVFLDELDPNRGRMSKEIMQDCGIMCYLAFETQNNE